MSSQCQLQESSLPQEEFEGVDPVEWVKMNVLFRLN